MPLARTTGLHERVIDYASSVHEQQTPSDVLNALHDITTKSLSLPVLGAARFPSKASGWDSAQLGDSIFLHKGVPKGWWEEYEALARGKFRPLLFLAQSSMTPCTWTEAKQVWSRPGLTDGRTTCSSNMESATRFVVPLAASGWLSFGHARPFRNILEQQTRSIIFAAASFSALRLEEVTRPGRVHEESSARLTPREIAVLRWTSTGARTREVAEALRIGVETVRTHLKNAQLKLGVRNRAMRWPRPCGGTSYLDAAGRRRCI